MIKMVLHGRAGNQLFQYAFARFLAYKHKTRLCFDISLYGRNKKQYILPRFNIVGKTINPIPALLFRRVFKKPLWQLSCTSIYREEINRFDESALSLPKSCTLYGNFQSERYFKPIENIIRSEIHFDRFPIEKETLELEKKILNSNSVSLHVRRSDYLDMSRHGNRYNVCTMEYYIKAMALIHERVNNPCFYIFSDDILWCIHHFRDSRYTFVNLQQSQKDPLNDMRLMSLCQHNIIANSSFSWWGAWLNRNSQKIVICPYIWFNAKDIPIKDKICEGWLEVAF